MEFYYCWITCFYFLIYLKLATKSYFLWGQCNKGLSSWLLKSLRREEHQASKGRQKAMSSSRQKWNGGRSTHHSQNLSPPVWSHPLSVSGHLDPITFFMTFLLRGWPLSKDNVHHFRHVPHRAPAHIFRVLFPEYRAVTIRTPPARLPLWPEEESQRNSPFLPQEKKDRFHRPGEGTEHLWMNPHAPDLFPFFSLVLTALPR